MPNENESNIEAQNNDDGQNQTNETLLAQKSHWKEKASKFETELETLKRENEELKASKTNFNKETNKNNENNGEVDYSKMAYLNSVDVRHPDDQKAIMDEAERLKLSLTDVLNMPHMKDKLKQAKNQRTIEDGMPKSEGTSSGKTKGDVDYWVNKTDKEGNFITPQDSELASKVIEARMKRESNKNMFDPIKI